jgi:hypothetical protein
MTEVTIVGTMLLSGAVGGLINSYLSDPVTEKPLTWWQHIILGIVAAFIVPVFLNTISSRLIAEIKIMDKPLTSEILSKLLVLSGFCLVAAVSSRTFIRSMTDRLLQEVSAAKNVAIQAKQQADNASAIASLSVETEPQDELGAGKSLSMVATPKPEVTEIERKILQAMVNSRFSMRSISGIAKDSSLPREQVNTCISDLISKALIMEGTNSEGQPRWYPTPLGRTAANGT